jgi:hypothetical protein
MRRTLCAICWSFIVLLAVSGSWATTQVRLTDDELIERSSLIVIGQCAEVRSVWMGRRLVTLATIAVHEVLKGEPHTQITVVIPGGIDTQRKVPVAAAVAGAPQISPAEEMVLFLTRTKGEPDGYAVTGLAQGKFSVVEDASGRQMVSPGRVVPPQDNALSTEPSPSPPEAVPLAQLRAKIVRRVGSSSP